MAFSLFSNNTQRKGFHLGYGMWFGFLWAQFVIAVMLLVIFIVGALGVSIVGGITTAVYNRSERRIETEQQNELDRKEWKERQERKAAEEQLREKERAARKAQQEKPEVEAEPAQAGSIIIYILLILVGTVAVGTGIYVVYEMRSGTDED